MSRGQFHAFEPSRREGQTILIIAVGAAISFGSFAQPKARHDLLLFICWASRLRPTARAAHFFAGQSPNLSGLDVKSQAVACELATEHPGAAALAGDTSGIEVPPSLRYPAR